MKISEEVADSAASVIEIIDSIYDSRAMLPENARSNNVELQIYENKLAMPEALINLFTIQQMKRLLLRSSIQTQM